MNTPKLTLTDKQKKSLLTQSVFESFNDIAEYILSSNKDISLIRVNKKEVAFKIRNGKFLLRAAINLSENKITYNTNKMFLGKWLYDDFLDIVSNENGVQFVNGIEISTVDRFGFSKHNLPFGLFKNFAKNYIDEMIIWEANYF